MASRRASPSHGWPVGAPEPFCDPRAEGWNPDGAVVDAAGNLWNAQYGGFRVAVYGPDGAFREAHAVAARNTTCPAFGGAGLDRLFCTSATQHMDAKTLAEHPDNGKTFVIDGVGPGQAEHRVIL